MALLPALLTTVAQQKLPAGHGSVYLLMFAVLLIGGAVLFVFARRARRRAVATEEERIERERHGDGAR